MNSRDAFSHLMTGLATLALYLLALQVQALPPLCTAQQITADEALDQWANSPPPKRK